MLVDNM